MNPETVAVEVTLPRELLSDIDEYATHHGYTTPSAVVTQALAEREGHTERGRVEPQPGR